MAEGDIVMKANIHPKYGKITVTCSTCGNTFESGSTAKEIRVDTCANCHPFFTGKQNSRQLMDGSTSLTNVTASKTNKTKKPFRMVFFLFLRYNIG